MSILVIDTSVFLSDPNALERLESEHVVIPLAVLLELEAKRHHSELGYAARVTLRKLEEYRKQFNQLSEEMMTATGGSLKVEIDDQNESHGLKIESMDDRILSVAYNLQAQGFDVILLSKDLPLRLRASLYDIDADEYEVDHFKDDLPELVGIEVDKEDIDTIYSDGILELEDSDLPENIGCILQSPTSSAIAIHKGMDLMLVRNSSVFGVNGRSAEQRIALELLTDPDIPIISLSGRSGSGKSLLALAAGLEGVLESQTYKRVIVFRPLYAVGGQDLGYLPGTADEKMEPWAAAVYDTLSSFCGANVLEEIKYRDLIQVLPLTHIRGRTLEDSFVIIDEAQQLEKMVLLTALTRLGKNSKVALTYDINQRDNLKVGKYDGVAAVSHLLHGNPLFAHVTLNKSERSPVAELVSTLLEA